MKAGDHIVYRDERRKQLAGGRVQRVVVQQQHLSITLDSGTRLQGRQICSVASINQDGTMTAARTVREEDLLMPLTAPSLAPQNESPAVPTPRSPWYHHWKDIATMTVGILPQSRVLPPS